LQHAFSLDVLMVPSLVFAFSADGDHLTCGGFSFDETVHLGSFEFITDYFGGLRLSHRKSDLGIAFMGPTHNGLPSPQWATIEDSTEEFHMASSRGGGSTCSHQKPTVLGGCTGHLVYDNSSTAGVDTAAAHQTLFRAMMHSS
jgi:hypothetical protein